MRRYKDTTLAFLLYLSNCQTSIQYTSGQNARLPIKNVKLTITIIWHIFVPNLTAWRKCGWSCNVGILRLFEIPTQSSYSYHRNSPSCRPFDPTFGIVQSVHDINTAPLYSNWPLCYRGGSHCSSQIPEIPSLVADESAKRGYKEIWFAKCAREWEECLLRTRLPHTVNTSQILIFASLDIWIATSGNPIARLACPQFCPLLFGPELCPAR